MEVGRFRIAFRMRIEALVHSSGRVEEWWESRLKVWVDGEEVFPRIERLLLRAKHSIAVQMFVWKDDRVGRRIALLLLKAAERGVRVQIAKEELGDGLEFDEDFLSTRDADDPVWKGFWSHPNITVHFVRQGDHTKAFVFDGRILLLGGMNIGEEYRSEWHDFFVELHGTRFVTGFLLGEGASSPQGTIRLVQNAARRRQIRPCLLELLRSARTHVFLEQSYVSDPQVLGELAALSRRGVTVTLILPEIPDFHAHANRQAAALLLERGDHRFLQVLLYPRMLHGKLVFVDGRRAFLGSANLLTSSLDWMGEANVLIDRWHTRAILKLRRAIRRDVAMSRPLLSVPRLGLFGKLLALFGL